MLLGHARSRQDASPTADGQQIESRSDPRSPTGGPRSEPSSWSQTESQPAGQADQEPEATAWDLVDEWGAQSFPASDPPANW
jgi:hypothetical protein